MFDTELEAALGDSRALTDLAADVENDSRIAGCRKLLVAAAWADAHSSVDHPDGGMLVERLLPIGPVGCPAVAEFAAQGLVGPFDASTQSVRSWMSGRVDHPPPTPQTVGTGDRRRRAPLEGPPDRHPDRPPGRGGGRRGRSADRRVGGAAALADLPESPGRHHAAGRRIHLPGTGTTRRRETGSPRHTVGGRVAHPDRPRRSRRRDDAARALPTGRRMPRRRRRRGPAAGADVESHRHHREPGPADRSPRPARRRPRPAPGTLGEGRRPPCRSDRPLGRRPPPGRLGNLPARQLPPTRDRRRRVVGYRPDRRPPGRGPAHGHIVGVRARPRRPGLVREQPRPADATATAERRPARRSQRAASARSGGRRRSGHPAGDRSLLPSWPPAHPQW